MNNISFMDVIVKEATEISEVAFHELNDQGGRYYDLNHKYEVIVE